MRKQFLISVLFALLTILIPHGVFASFDKLYIDGKQCPCFLLVDFDEVYIASQDAEKVFGRSDIEFDPSTNAVTIGGRAVPAKITFYEKIPCLPVIAICKELSLPARWDHYSGRIEISQIPKPTIKTPDQAGEEKQTRRQRIRKKRGLSISLIGDEHIKDLSDKVMAIRVQTIVRNTYFREIKRAAAKCVFTYPDGTVLREDEVIVYGIKPDESRRIIFYTENPSMTQTPEYKFEIKEIRTE